MGGRSTFFSFGRASDARCHGQRHIRRGVKAIYRLLNTFHKCRFQLMLGIFENIERYTLSKVTDQNKENPVTTPISMVTLLVTQSHYTANLAICFIKL